MIWYRDDDITIRDMDPADARVFTDEELRQGWHVSEEKYHTHLGHRDQGRCVPLTAEYRGAPAGYINVYREAVEGPFTGTGWPEIVDFGVLIKYRGRGIGTRLMDTAEGIAAGYADTVCLAVGLHNGYGTAQRMYVKRGYVPDGSGVWYRGKNCTPYDTAYTNDDDLVLYLSKKLSGYRAFRPVEAGSAGGPVRKAGPEDVRSVTELMAALWPGHDEEELAEEVRALAAGNDSAVFLYREGDRDLGFAQCSLRHDYVEGTCTSPVGYLEGVFVREASRRRGIAKTLLTACENWAGDRGCSEFASDCELDNVMSRRFHLAAGFKEANRLVAFVKPLGPGTEGGDPK